MTNLEKTQPRFCLLPARLGQHWGGYALTVFVLQKQGRFEVYEGDAQPPMSPPVGANAQALMEQNLGSKPNTPEHGG